MTNFAYSSAINNLVGNTPGANIADVVQCFNDLKTFLNSPNLDGTNVADVPESLLALALQQKLGLNDGSQIGRGKSIIATDQSTTSASYVTLSTPDQVQNVVLPTDGLLEITYQAEWYESVPGAARAAIFIGSNQLRFAATAAGTAVQEASLTGTAGTATPLSTFAMGLGSTAATSAYGGDVTTGQVIGVINSGGSCKIFADAGTYTISIKYKCSSGNVHARNRKLWVKAEGF